MSLPTKIRDQYYSDMASSFAGSVGISPILKDGNVFRAIFLAVAEGGDMFLQSQAVQTYNYARATSCVGPDLDSYVAQFGLKRLQGTKASGACTVGLSKVASIPTLVRPGIIIQAVGGSPQYQIIADPAEAAWSPSDSAYVIPVGILNINVTVQALNVGSASTVQAGQLTQFATASSSLSTVTNTQPILNGFDNETDDALRERFIINFNATNANGTLNAYLKLALGVQTGLDIAIIENVDQNGNDVDAFVMLIVDDGSGSPPTSLLNAVYTAVNTIRAGGIEVVVFGPILAEIASTLNIRIDPNADAAIVTLNVENAILDYVDSLAIGQTLYLSQIEKAAMNVAGVLAVEPDSCLINDARVDLVAGIRTIFRITNENLTIGTY